MAFDPISIGITLAKIFLGSAVKKAYEKYKESKEEKKAGIPLKKIEKVDVAYVIPEIGRPIANNLISRFGLDEARVVKITYDRSIQPEEIHLIAGEIVRVIDELQKYVSKIILVAPAPMPLSFILGQYIGMGYINLELLWIQGDHAYLLSDGHKCRKPLFSSDKEASEGCVSKIV